MSPLLDPFFVERYRPTLDQAAELPSFTARNLMSGDGSTGVSFNRRSLDSV
jgi:hypothetical protein